MANMKIVALLLAFFAAIVAASKPNVRVGNNGIVQLDDHSFSELTRAPREHYAVVLLTALGSQFNCVFCKQFDPEYTLLASSWQKSSARKQSPEVYFGHLDFQNGQNTFRSLQLVSAPNLWIYPPTIDENGETVSGEPIRYDFTNSPTGEAAAEFISQSIKRDFVLKRPFDYVKFARFTVTIGFFLAFIGFLYRVAGFVFMNKNFWTIISILLILVFNAGYMYTQIRGSPYSRGGGGYIAGGFQDQFGAETQIVAAICNASRSPPVLILMSIDGLLSFSVVILAISVPRIKNAQAQTMLIAVWVIVQIFVFSFLIQLFRQKNGGYPFKLLL